MRVFVTGATGVIGRRVVPLLVRSGHAVTALSHSAAKRAMLERAGATVVAADLFDRHALRPVLAGHDAVINLATHMPSSATRMMIRYFWRENDHIRRDGSAALADAAMGAGVKRFLQESFAPVYEDAGDRWIDEQWPIRPTAYNRTVIDAEHSAARFAAGGGAGVVLRFAAFYGGDSRVLHDMLGYVRKGWAPLPGRADAYISSVSHDDAAAAVVAALGVPSGVYNVTDDEPLTRAEWAAALADAIGVDPPKPLPAWFSRLGSTMELLSRSLRMSNRKLRTATEWRPKWPSVREGWRALAPELRAERASSGVVEAPSPHSSRLRM
jgi:nucleoside-diphosphate-sugar epimerase